MLELEPEPEEAYSAPPRLAALARVREQAQEPEPVAEVCFALPVGVGLPDKTLPPYNSLAHFRDS